MLSPGRVLVPLTVVGILLVGPAVPGWAGAPDTVTVTGTFTEVLPDGHYPGQSLPSISTITVDGSSVEVPAELTAGLASGQRVAVEVDAPPGVDTRAEVADALQEGQATIVNASPAASPPVAATTAGHSLTVLPVYWSAKEPSTSIGTLTTLANRVGAYWRKQSGGSVVVSSTTVVDWTRISAPKDCEFDNLDAMLDAARAKANVAEPSAHSHVLLYFPQFTKCGWAGLAYVGGGAIWINGYAYADAWEHEFGHNLGLGHANEADCAALAMGSVSKPGCGTAPYADYDVMGYARYGEGLPLNAALADVIGTLGDAPEAALNSSYQIAPITAVGSTRAVKVTIPGSTLYVEYRPSPAPQVRGLAGWSGVQVRQRFDGRIESYVLVPSKATARGKPATIPRSGMALVVDSVSATSARMHFVTAPTEVATPAVTMRTDSTAKGIPVTITGSATNLGIGVCKLSATVNGKTIKTVYRATRLTVSAYVPKNHASSVVIRGEDCQGHVATRSITVRSTLAGNSAGTFTGRWSLARSSGYLGGSAKSTRSGGSKVTWTFTGSKVGWVGSRRSWTGTAKMYIDGKYVGKIDTRGARADRRLMWTRSVSSGKHRLAVVVTGSKGRPTVFQDGFVSLR